MTISDFILQFETNAYHELDQFAMLACQSYNLGNRTDWFGSFRGGLYGLYARLHGVTTHYHTVHTWLPREREPVETEYHLASIFFNMDSAVECFTFALNALGSSAASNDFRDVTDVRALKRVTPRNILGDSHADPPQQPLAGYSKIFPSVQACWQQHQRLIDHIVEQHDVSKHRQTIFIGGQCRLDPPPGFYEKLGVPDDPTIQSCFWPMAEIIIEKAPKSPAIDKVPQTREEQILLEDVAQEFVSFINETGRAALDDARAKIILTE